MEETLPTLVFYSRKQYTGCAYAPTSWKRVTFNASLVSKQFDTTTLLDFDDLDWVHAQKGNDMLRIGFDSRLGSEVNSSELSSQQLVFSNEWSRSTG